MPQITQISPQKKKGFFNIFIDGKFAFGLDSETLIKEKVTEGKALLEKDVEALKEASLYSKLLNGALNFLSFRPRSKKELGRNLDARLYRIIGKRDEDLSQKLKQQVVSKIEGWGYLNDGEFARWWVEQRTKGKSLRGPQLIKTELMGKGVDRKVIDEALKNFKEAVSKDALVQMLGKKGRLLKNKPLFEQRRKLYDFLLRRGFDFDVAREAVANYLKTA